MTVGQIVSALCTSPALGETKTFTSVADASAFQAEKAAERDAWITRMFGE